MSEGYILIGVGKKYIDECKLFVDTLRKNGDSRPVSIVTEQKDIDYTKSLGVFDQVLEFQIFDQDMWSKCETPFDRYGVYPRVFMDKYIRYEHNINVDSDILCQAPTERLWNFLKNRKESIGNLGHKTDPSWHWGTLHEVSEAFGKPVPHTHAGMTYMRNDQFTRDYFEFVRDVFNKYDSYKCKRMYQDGMTEEIMFAIAHSQFDIDPIEFDQVPVMTFNITADMVPTRIFTLREKEMPELIPFVHMFTNKPGSEVYNEVYTKIMTTYFSPIPVVT